MSVPSTAPALSEEDCTGDFDDPCELDDIEVTVCQNPDSFYNEQTGVCEPNTPDEPDDPDLPWDDDTGCDPVFEDCGGGGGGSEDPGGPGAYTCPIDAIFCDDPPPDVTLDFTESDSSDIQVPINCSDPSQRQVLAIDAFCLGTPVKQTPHWSQIDATINRIAARGGPCVAIANAARTLANSGRFRLYDGRHAAGYGDQTNQYMFLTVRAFSVHYNDLTWRSSRVPDHAVAHEAEHTLGAVHASLYGIDARYNTPNSIRCGGGIV